MRIGIIGLGNLGTAIGNLITANGFNVISWEHNHEIAEEIKKESTRKAGGFVFTPKRG
jgi:glycerol-3-phosphate dehydrogenase